MQARIRSYVLIGTAAAIGVILAVVLLSRRSAERLPVADVASAPAPESPIGGLSDGSDTPLESAVVANDVPREDATTVAAKTAPQLVREARALLAQARFADAEQHAEQAVEMAPTSGSAWNVLGRSQLSQERLDKAEVSFARACEVDSNNAWAHNNLGLLYLKRGQWQEALPLLETAVRLKDDVAYFHNNLGVAYENLRRLQDAARAYARAVELEPSHTTAELALLRVRAQLPPALVAVSASASDSVTHEPVEPEKR